MISPKYKPETEFQEWFFMNAYRLDLNTCKIAERLHTTRQTVCNHYRKEKSIPYVYILGYCTLFGDGDPDEIWKQIHEN